MHTDIKSKDEGGRRKDEIQIQPSSFIFHPYFSSVFICVHLWLIFFFNSSAFAETRVSFPFDGYYRTGKFMPVRIEHDSAPANLSLLAGGTIETRIHVERSETLVPWLAVNRIENPSFRIDQREQSIDVAFRALTENQLLVGITSNDIDVAQQHFPGREIIPVALDPANPLPPPIQAWTGLDAVILGESARTRLSPDVLDRLLAAGVSIVTPGQTPELLGVNLRGPQSLVSEAAYLPAQSWRPQWPASIRWRVFLFGVIFALALLLVSLLRPKPAATSGVILCAAAVIFLLLWRNNLPRVHEIGGSIFVNAESGIQQDRWIYQTSAHDTSAQIPADYLPVFASESYFRDSQIVLECTPEGRPISFTHRLPANTRMAYLQRRIIQPPMPATTQPITSPLLDLARRAYLLPGDKITGQSTDGDWPDVVIQTPPSRDRSRAER